MSPRRPISGGSPPPPRTAFRVLALLATGVAYAFMAPPINAFWLHPIIWIPYFWATRDLSPKRSALAAWLTGFAAQLTIFPWLIHTMRVYSSLPLPLCVLAWILFALVWGTWIVPLALVQHRVRSVFGSYWPFAWAGLYIALQRVWPQLFPWYDGVVWYQQSWVFQIAALGGSAMMGFLALSTAVVVYQTVEARRLPRANAAILALCWVAAIGFSVARVQKLDRLTKESGTTRVALVQINSPLRPIQPTQQEATEWARRIRGRLRELLEASKKAVGQGAEVIVWPEAAVALDIAGDDIRARAIREAFGMWEVQGIVGGMYMDQQGDRMRDYNSAFFVDAQAQAHARYDKIILLPFGEYMPGATTFPGLKKLIAGVGDLEPGDHRVLWNTRLGTLGYVICYEAIRPRLVRQFVLDGAEVIVNGTNDAWFGDSAAPHQHAMLATIRSVELGVPMLRAANSGLSFWVDLAGRQHNTSLLYQPALLVFDLPQLQQPTLYRAFGEWFAWLCGLIPTLLLAASWRRRRQRG